jgi:uncharacterized membrane protein YbhN (UPF0104 family)
LIPTAALAVPEALPLRADAVAVVRSPARRRLLLTVLGTLVTIGVLAYVLAGRGSQFKAALVAAPIWLLALAAVLHLGSLVTRAEAWNGCVVAAGGTVPRRVVLRAAGIGSLASVISAQLGVALRIAALRRSAPETSPRIPAMMAAEVPIVAVETTLAALFMFTLVGPLHLPVWLPLVAIALMFAAIFGLRGVARRHRSGLWLGLAALRDFEGRRRLVGLVILEVLAQIARNWLVLRAVGVNASVFDAIAVLIVTVSLSPLPIGPSVGAAATVLILGSHGVAATTAGGLLLTVTGIVGALSFAAWACADHLLARLRRSARASRLVAAPLRAGTWAPRGLLAGAASGTHDIPVVLAKRPGRR